METAVGRLSAGDACGERAPAAACPLLFDATGTDEKVTEYYEIQ